MWDSTERSVRWRGRQGPELIPHTPQQSVGLPQVSTNIILHGLTRKPHWVHWALHSLICCAWLQLGLTSISSYRTTALSPSNFTRRAKGLTSHFQTHRSTEKEPFQLLRWSAANSCAKFPCCWGFLASSARVTVSQPVQRASFSTFPWVSDVLGKSLGLTRVFSFSR